MCDKPSLSLAAAEAVFKGYLDWFFRDTKN